MSALLWVDGLFAGLCGTLSGPLRDEARRLSFTLGLAPEPLTPWSRVFSHEVTLAAPSMFAEGMPSAPGAAAKHALSAHALAVIEAMGADRIGDGQARATPALLRVLDAIRAARDEHLDLAGGPAAIDSAARADAELAAAMRAERELLLGRESVDLVAYEAISARKQAPGLVATVALAGRAGWSAARITFARRALLDMALALQVYDDVIDWEEDAIHGRSWALSLARAATRADRAPGDPAARRPVVHASGVLARMLRRARFRFHAGARRAGALGAARLAAWAEERARTLEPLAEREERHAGYLHRARALGPWARAVLGSTP